jgi:uncharacterized SAM-binding protein YcdF (DUF218 family)
MAAVLVTGDVGLILPHKSGNHMPLLWIHHEPVATTAMESARVTDPVVDGLNRRQAVLVANWFHVPQSVASFRALQPERA